MFNRALSFVGALVLLSYGGIAGAMSVEQYVILESVGKLTDSQLRDIGYANDGATFGGADVSFNGKNVVWDSTSYGNFTNAVLSNPSEEYINFKKFKSTHAKNFTGSFSFPLNEWIIDGTCSFMPGVRKDGLIINGSNPPDLVRIEFYSTSRPQNWYFMYASEARYNYAINGANQERTSDIGGGLRDKTDVSLSQGALWSDLCYNPQDLKFTSYLVMDIASNQYKGDGGMALRQAVKASLESYFAESKPKIVGITVTGYTLAELQAECTSITCPNQPLAPGSGGSTPGETPTDPETNCSLIDIPCNLKKLFIPRKEFLSSKLENGVGLTVKFPLTVADSWMTTVTFAEHTFPVGADFSTLTWNEETKDQFRFFAWWSTFLFLLGYLGVPFMGGKRGMADSAKDATVGAAAREAAENDRSEAAYRSLRADDSWKNP